jgi:hypothetical protein
VCVLLYPNVNLQMLYQWVVMLCQYVMHVMYYVLSLDPWNRIQRAGTTMTHAILSLLMFSATL